MARYGEKIVKGKRFDGNADTKPETSTMDERFMLLFTEKNTPKRKKNQGSIINGLYKKWAL